MSGHAPSGERPWVFLYGAYPPPIGGVSIHLRRFVALLQERGVPFRFAHPNDAPGSPHRRLAGLALLAAVVRSRAPIVHLHGFGHRGLHAMLAVLALVLRRRVVITIHNKWFADEYRNLRGVPRLLARVCFRSAARVLVTSTPNDLLFVPPQRVMHVPPFLAPAPDELAADALPDDVIELRRRHRVLLCANAFRIWFQDGLDLYGLDHCVELLGRLDARGERDVAFVYALPEVVHPEYLAKLRARVDELGLGGRFLFVARPIPFPALLSISDVFVRPTTSDGEALSLSEALHLGKFAIASDAVVRCPGTRLFRTRDLEDLEAKVCEVTSAIRAGQRPAPNGVPDGGEQLLSLYRELLPRRRRLLADWRIAWAARARRPAESRHAAK